ncbi:hypothetical protein BHM03_00010658, partial [Ensete ventricosum]
ILRSALAGSERTFAKATDLESGSRRGFPLLSCYFHLLQACSMSAGSPKETGAEVQDEKSEIYSTDMTKAMGADILGLILVQFVNMPCNMVTLSIFVPKSGELKYFNGLFV